jgi:hypothetical protein
MRLLLFSVCIGSVLKSFSQPTKNEIGYCIVHTDTSFTVDLYPPANFSNSLKWKIQGIDTFITETRPTITLPDSGKFKIELFTNPGSKQNYYSTFLIIKNDSLSKIHPTAFQCGFACGSGYDLCIKSNGVIKFKAAIYNRWGELVFESNEAEITWEKKHYKTNAMVPVGTYYIILEWVDQCSNNHRYINYWTFIR